jgi:hypothetical protein
MGSVPDRVEKLMSLDLDEFHRSLKTLSLDVSLEHGQVEVHIPAGRSKVQIVYETLQRATLGGLLSLPRAKVTLHLDGLDEAERQTFLARFDKAFQRGGG